MNDEAFDVTLECISKITEINKKEQSESLSNLVHKLYDALDECIDENEEENVYDVELKDTINKLTEAVTELSNQIAVLSVPKYVWKNPYYYPSLPVYRPTWNTY